MEKYSRTYVIMQEIDVADFGQDKSLQVSKVRGIIIKELPFGGILMTRPYIICHMTTSIDGKVTGEFLSDAASGQAIETYYERNRNFASNGFICGRITMESSFTGGWYPDLSQYREVEGKSDFLVDDRSGFYAVAFDTKGRLGWQSNTIIDPDGDPGYDGAQIIEVLSEQADGRYLGYLQAMKISYIFAGAEKIDVALALKKLKELFDCETLLLEGGSILNGAFQRAGVIDELSLVVASVVADREDKPLFTDATMEGYHLVEMKQKYGTLWLNYKKNEP